MNLLEMIVVATDQARPLAQQRQQEEQLQRLGAQISYLLRQLAPLGNSLTELRLKARLLTEVYGRADLPEVAAAYDAARRALASDVPEETFLSNLEPFALAQALNETTRLLAQAAAAVDLGLDEIRREALEAVSAARALQKIPDLFASAHDQRRLQDAAEAVLRLLGQKGDDVTGFRVDNQQFAEAWRGSYGDLVRLREESSFEQLQRRHQLSDATMQLLHQLLGGAAVPLGSMPQAALDELLRLGHLREQVTLQLSKR